uniref:Uncharacterized protein conserved in bacteria n=1 Tax=uncultured alpha proteobacterium HF0070_17D04 TaxID=710805 RepID=E0XS89_9PROT|nr:uncharacterized protein conserved in bacteria [uncultured alpha proteobacterium HF0070_17D04]
MIKYQLICDKSHEFEGWFGDAAFESQQEAGLLTCPVCGSADVRRALMAPNLASPKTRKTDLAEQQPSAQPEPQPQAPQQASAALPPAAARKRQELMSKMRALQTKIREECRDVGNDFANEARKIHYGEVEPEGIYGQATAEEREALDEEGIEIMDMPWLPKDN